MAHIKNPFKFQVRSQYDADYSANISVSRAYLFNKYIDTEIMSQTQNGYMALLIELRNTSNDVILRACTNTASGRGRGIAISTEICTGYRTLCATNVTLLARISHGLSTISEIYEKSANDNYFELVKISLKKERLLLEAIVEKFAYIIT